MPRRIGRRGKTYFSHPMKTSRPGSPHTNLEILLILGTDLAGKDHFANVLADAAAMAGIPVERRRGSFAARPDSRRTTEGKSRLKLCLEWLFLATLPLYCRLLPYVLAAFIRWDLWRFQPPTGVSVIVVSHTGLRLLAFALGHTCKNIEDIKLPAVVEKALRLVVPVTGMRTLVLDIDHRVRAARMAERRRRGTVDFFDRYLAGNPELSERIESILVWLGITYLGAVRVENNDLSDAELLSALPEELRRRCGTVSRPG